MTPGAALPGPQAGQGESGGGRPVQPGQRAAAAVPLAENDGLAVGLDAREVGDGEIDVEPERTRRASLRPWPYDI